MQMQITWGAGYKMKLNFVAPEARLNLVIICLINVFDSVWDGKEEVEEEKKVRFVSRDKRED